MLSVFRDCYVNVSSLAPGEFVFPMTVHRSLFTTSLRELNNCKNALVIALVVLTACNEYPRATDSTPVHHASTRTIDTTITLVFGGDVMSHMPLVRAAWNPAAKVHEYLHWYEFIQPIVSGADLAVANLETTLAGEPYTGFPCFSAPDALAVDLQRAGFDVLVTANNHVADKGRRGIERTIRVLDSLGMYHTGSYRTQQERDTLSPLLINIKGMKVALLSYTYSTNGLPVPPPNVVNLIDDSTMTHDIAQARRKGADLIIAIMHWGNEYQTTEHPSQRRTAELLASKGVDAIVGMHPHVLQPISHIMFKGHSVPVAYSLGNLVGNMRKRYRNGGAMIKLTAAHRDGKTRISSFEAIPFFVWKGQLSVPDSASDKRALRHGFYMIPESQTSLLPVTREADQFFDDAKSILGPTQMFMIP